MKFEIKTILARICGVSREESRVTFMPWEIIIHLEGKRIKVSDLSKFGNSWIGSIIDRKTIPMVFNQAIVELGKMLDDAV